MKIGDRVKAVFEEFEKEWVMDAVIIYVCPIPNGFHCIQWDDGKYGWYKTNELEFIS